MVFQLWYYILPYIYITYVCWRFISFILLSGHYTLLCGYIWCLYSKCVLCHIFFFLLKHNVIIICPRLDIFCDYMKVIPGGDIASSIMIWQRDVGNIPCNSFYCTWSALLSTNWQVCALERYLFISYPVIILFNCVHPLGAEHHLHT